MPTAPYSAIAAAVEEQSATTKEIIITTVTSYDVITIRHLDDQLFKHCIGSGGGSYGELGNLCST